MSQRQILGIVIIALLIIAYFVISDAAFIPSSDPFQ